MSSLFGHTRSVVRRNYALLDPSGFVRSVVPGWEDAEVNIVISPPMGANFTQMHALFREGGKAAGDTGDSEFFAYVLSGDCDVETSGQPIALGTGGYLFVPPATRWTITCRSGTRLVVFQKRHERLGKVVPRMLSGHAHTVDGQPFLGDPNARLQVLLPDELPFDMAVNIFTYQPGATLPYVETHVMEHGLVMLTGQGIYRLHDDWHPVREGDVIWMGPYCPQWFVAMGKEPASYLYYKDVNRAPR
jgi:(S)-ureidoglycine aminohydrolase